MYFTSRTRCSSENKKRAGVAAGHNSFPGSGRFRAKYGRLFRAGHQGRPLQLGWKDCRNASGERAVLFLNSLLNDWE